jgi:alcohol dehydrogenase (cytochrome c)
MTLAPLVIKDKVVIGLAGADLGVRGFIAAYEAKTGKEAWRFYTIPGPGEPGHETWSGDAWMHGGASIWVTGSYDPELNLTYWGTGNPAPALIRTCGRETIFIPVQWSRWTPIRAP